MTEPLYTANPTKMVRPASTIRVIVYNGSGIIDLILMKMKTKLTIENMYSIHNNICNIGYGG